MRERPVVRVGAVAGQGEAARGHGARAGRRARRRRRAAGAGDPRRRQAAVRRRAHPAPARLPPPAGGDRRRPRRRDRRVDRHARPDPRVRARAARDRRAGHQGAAREARRQRGAGSGSRAVGPAGALRAAARAGPRAAGGDPRRSDADRDAGHAPRAPRQRARHHPRHARAGRGRGRRWPGGPTRPRWWPCSRRRATSWRWPTARVESSYDRALEGTYAPGSTFKVVSTAALLRDGLSVGETVRCPPTIEAGGRQFKNFEGGAAGAVPFSRDFAVSCNTAFVSLAPRLAPDALSRTARDYGLGRKLDLAVPAAGGQVPPGEDAVERAAAMIGQHEILASPLAMASVAATVAAGRWRAPRLLASDPREAGPALPASERDTLRSLMRLVVTRGLRHRARRRRRRGAGQERHGRVRRRRPAAHPRVVHRLPRRRRRRGAGRARPLRRVGGGPARGALLQRARPLNCVSRFASVRRSARSTPRRTSRRSKAPRRPARGSNSTASRYSNPSPAGAKPALVAHVGQPALDAVVRHEPVGVEDAQRHLQLDGAAEQPHHDPGAIARRLPPRARLHADQVGPVLRPVARLDDVVEALAQRDREAPRQLEAHRRSR